MKRKRTVYFNIEYYEKGRAVNPRVLSYPVPQALQAWLRRHMKRASSIITLRTYPIYAARWKNEDISSDSET